jgi:hypothetical protein
MNYKSAFKGSDPKLLKGSDTNLNNYADKKKIYRKNSFFATSKNR